MTGWRSQAGSVLGRRIDIEPGSPSDSKKSNREGEKLELVGKQGEAGRSMAVGRPSMTS